jgi:hypothetical protein
MGLKTRSAKLTADGLTQGIYRSRSMTRPSRKLSVFNANDCSKGHAGTRLNCRVTGIINVTASSGSEYTRLDAIALLPSLVASSIIYVGICTC